MTHTVDIRVPSKYAGVNRHYIEKNNVYIIAWETEDENREDLPIAKIDIDTREVEYLDEDAKLDAFAQAMIVMAVNDLKR